MPTGLRTLTYYAKGALPRAPEAMTAPTADWGMLGNNHYGDCGVAGLQHGFQAAAVDTHKKTFLPTAQQAVAYYLHYTHGQDSGVALMTYLLYVHKVGYYGNKVQAFAPVTPKDIPTLKFVTNAYDFTYLGIVVTTLMEKAFATRQPWKSSTLRGNILGGHCVCGVGYDDLGITVVTWGGIQKLTWAAFQEMERIGDAEAIAVITGEIDEGDGHGIAYATLVEDLAKI